MKKKQSNVTIAMGMVLFAILVNSCSILTDQRFGYRDKVKVDGVRSVEQPQKLTASITTIEPLMASNEVGISGIILPENEVKLNKVLEPIVEVKAQEVLSPVITKQSLVNEKNKARPTVNSGGDQKTDGLALTGFIVGLVSLFVPAAAALPLGILAVICGVIGMANISKDRATKKGMGFAIVALICGIIATIFGIAMLSAK